MNKLLIVFVLLIVFSFSPNNKVYSYGECDEYGFMAMSDGLGSCVCMSGYSFGKDIFGKTSCISDYQLCQDQYGYHATSDYSGGCKCNYGYVISGGKCVDGDSYCRDEHGLWSSYSGLSNKCECDTDYTFDDNYQCVEKQNNVYFTLKELDTYNKQAIIKSDYDYSYYLITYNTGCYSMSFPRYLNHQIVVNLGTDTYLDTWDKIVLQNDDETCDITRKEKVDSSFTLEPEEEEEDTTIYYTPPVIKNTTTTKNVVTPTPKSVVNKPDTENKKEIITPEAEKVEGDEEVIPVFTPEPLKKAPWYKRLWRFVWGN